MRLPSSNAQLDGNVTNFLLHELRQSAHLIESCWSRCRELRSLLLDFWRSFALPIRQAALPFPHGVPIFESVASSTGAAEQGNDHEPAHALPRRHSGLWLNSFDIAHYPLPLAPSARSRHFGMVQPNGLVLPSSRELQRVVRFSNRHVHSLKSPNILHHVRAQFLFNFVTDDVAWV